MNLFSYVPAMLELGTVGAYIGVGFFAFLALWVLFGLLRGLRHGITRQLLSTVMMLCAAVVAFFVTTGVCGRIFSELEATSIEELIIEIENASGSALPEEAKEILTATDVKTLEYVLALPVGAIVAPLAFMLIFLVLHVIFKIIGMVLRCILRPQKGGGAVRRLTGLALGALHGFIVAAIIILPFAAITTTAEAAMLGLSDSTEDEEMAIVYEEEIKPLAESPAFSIVKTVGGDLLLDALGTVKIDGEKLNTRQELIALLSLITSDYSALADADFKNPDTEVRAAIEKLIDDITDSDFLSTVTCGILSAAATSLDGSVEDADDSFSKIISSLISVFKTSNKTYLNDDLTTVKNVYFILADGEVLSSMDSGNSDDIKNALSQKDASGDTVIKKVIAEIEKNDRTKPLVSALAELSVDILLSEYGIDGDAAVIYEELKGDLRNTLAIKSSDYSSEEEYKAAVAESLNTALIDKGIELEEDILNSMADYVNDNHKDIENISDDEINDVLLSYYDAYLEYTENNPQAPGPEIGDLEDENFDENMDPNGWTE